VEGLRHKRSPNGSRFIRGTCIVPSCNNIQAPNGMISKTGMKRFRLRCFTHNYKQSAQGKLHRRRKPARERSVCSFKDCNRLQAGLRRSKAGRRYYSLWCDYHRHNRKTSVPAGYWKEKMKTIFYRQSVNNTKCERCGWDKALCDRHRLIPGHSGGEYKEGNIIVLCPNCHRLEHIPK